jgi:hypothetical protein
MVLSVLHISDLHRDPANPISNDVLLDSLERDRDRYTSEEDPIILAPNLIIVSGDMVQGIKYATHDAEKKLREQYEEALHFLNELTKRFLNGDKSRVVIVPGNHDVSDHIFRQSLTNVELDANRYKPMGAELFKPGSLLRWSWEDFNLYEITDWECYKLRLSMFCQLYQDFYEGQRQFLQDPDQQFDIFDFPDDGVIIAGFSSCHNNDLLNRQGAIHPECIAQAGRQVRDIARWHNGIRIGVWHHNMEGPPFQSNYMDPDVVQNLIDSGFSLGFHGHQHRPQFLDTRFRHSVDRRITVVSAGTLCGGPAFRHGRAYNLVEIDPSNNNGRIHLREMENDNLQMPIWGPRAIPPHLTSHLDFKFDPPPQTFGVPDRKTLILLKAQEHYDNSDYVEAARLFGDIASSDSIARRLLLQCLLKLEDTHGIIAGFDPPRSAAEAIALMDALWAAGAYDHLKKVMEHSIIAETEEPSVGEIRAKYEKRLSK